MTHRTGSFFPTKEEINKAIYAFSNKQMLVFVVFFVVFLVSIFLILNTINQKYLIERALAGGTIEEGVIGSPRFLNPVLALSNTDRDLTTIIFSGLMKKDIHGVMQYDLAESYEVSGDRLTYTFKIKGNAVFHDKTRVTAEDILFTIHQIQDGKLKSPYQAAWQDVSVLKIDEQTVQFKLLSPYASFLENTSIGILPAHMWNDTDVDDFTFSDKNIYAVGSGPYKITHVEKKKNGLIESVSLVSFKEYAGQEAYIDEVKFSFYKNEEELIRAFKKNNVDQINAISGAEARILAEDKEEITNIHLSRIFGLFFNANKQEIFRNKNIVRAINLGIDKNQIVGNVLSGYGQIIDGPIPKKIYETEAVVTASHDENITEAKNILEKEGWVIGADGFRIKDGRTLTFSISTGDAGELQNTAEIIKNNLKEIGILVDVKIFEIGNLNQSVIRPREYESLFFGQIIGSEADLFAFWHSSQRNDPGLNIASYTNSKVDGLLEKIIKTSDETEKSTYYKDLNEEIKKDMPALFMYSPDFIYVTDKKVKNIIIDKITLPSERLTHINEWYIRTEKVWKFLNK